MKQFDVALFLPAGKVLLMGSFAYGLIKTMREEDDFSQVIETTLLGFLALTFYREAADGISHLSGEFIAMLKRQGGDADLMSQLAAALEGAIKERERTDATAFVLTSLKGGVWGTLMLISQFLFLVVEAVFHLSQKVFWNLILVLLPLAAGLYPAFPFLLKSLAIYAIELSLWLPVLTLINYCAAIAAGSPEVAQAPFGIGVAITQILVIFLIFTVPSITHRLMTGALDHALGAGAPAFQRMKTIGGSAYSGFRPKLNRVFRKVIPGKRPVAIKS